MTIIATTPNFDNCGLCLTTEESDWVMHDSENGHKHPFHRECLRIVANRHFGNFSCPMCFEHLNPGGLLSLKERVVGEYRLAKFDALNGLKISCYTTTFKVFLSRNEFLERGDIIAFSVTLVLLIALKVLVQRPFPLTAKLGVLLATYAFLHTYPTLDLRFLLLLPMISAVGAIIGGAIARRI